MATLIQPFNEVDRAILDGETEGFVRVHLRKGTDEILGATIVAEHAGDMISEITLAMTHKIGLGKIAATIHPYCHTGGSRPQSGRSIQPHPAHAPYQVALHQTARMTPWPLNPIYPS